MHAVHRGVKMKKTIRYKDSESPEHDVLLAMGLCPKCSAHLAETSVNLTGDVMQKVDYTFCPDCNRIYKETHQSNRPISLWVTIRT